MLQLGLEEAGITPQMFPDLVDKEYAAVTQKYIASNFQRLMSQLSPSEQQDVHEAIQSVQRNQDLEYYLTHYDNVANYRQAKPTYDKLASRNSCLVQIGIGVFLYLAIGLAFALLLLGSSVNLANTLLFSILLLVGVFIFVQRWRKGKEYKALKKEIDAFKSSSIDMERFLLLEKQFGNQNRQKLTELKVDTEKKIEQFFGTKSVKILT